MNEFTVKARDGVANTVGLPDPAAGEMALMALPQLSEGRSYALKLVGSTWHVVTIAATARAADAAAGPSGRLAAINAANSKFWNTGNCR